MAVYTQLLDPTLLKAALPLLVLVIAVLSGVVVSAITYASTPKVPGPILARFSRLWYAWKVWKGDFELCDIDLHRRYGKFSLKRHFHRLGFFH